MKRTLSSRRLIYFSLALILMTAVMLSACGSPATSTAPGTEPSATTIKPTTASSTAVTPKSGGTLRIGYNRDAVYLGDPIELTQQQDMVMSRPAIETLARYDSSGQLVPWLATGWTVNADDLTMTITLRKGVKFHDGTDFNAEAVKFNLDRFKASKRSELALVKSVDIVDDYTVKVGLSTWDNTIDGSLLYYAGNMASKQAFEKNGKAWYERTR